MSQYSFAWDSYQSSICSGFSSLQQNGEFVDMTLAADGHIVKVHQLLMALASPYLKELIASAPCQHPVIFLNNVNYTTLCSLLEYIYTGEVVVGMDNLASFVATAKSLHIKGLENVMNTGIGSQKVTVNQTDNSINASTVRSISIPTEQGVERVGLPPLARKVHLKRGRPTTSLMTPTIPEPKQEIYTYTHMEDSRQDSDDDDNASAFGTTDNTTDKQSVSSLQFTVSNRGSLQVILNRYIYNLHSTSHRSGMRRWRCVDYRNVRCPAYIVTKGNIVLNRSNLHTHSFHDKKILTKIERKTVYSAIDDVAGVKDVKDTDINDDDSMERDMLGEQFNDEK